MKITVMKHGVAMDYRPDGIDKGDIMETIAMKPLWELCSAPVPRLKRERYERLYGMMDDERFDIGRQVTPFPSQIYCPG